MKNTVKKLVSLVLAITILLPLGTVGITANAAKVYSYKIFIDNTIAGNSNSSSIYLIIKSTETGETKELQLASYGENSTESFTKNDITLSGSLENYPDYYPYGIKTSADLKFAATMEYEIHMYIYNNSINSWLLIANDTHYLQGPWFTSYVNRTSYTYASSSFFPNEDYGTAVKLIPSGYDFETDRWNFRNFSEKIALRYLVDMYEEQKGTELYNFREGQGGYGNTGHCFGMAFSTALTLINAPYVTDYISWTGLPYTKLNSVNKGTMNIDMDISAKDYIKYCHIYQDSLNVARQRNDVSHQGIRNVYNAVKSSTDNTDSTLTVIDFFGGAGNHSVYAVGIDGNDILVNDSNSKNTLQRIKINGSEWSYSGGGYSSEDTTIKYVSCSIEPYLRLTWGIDVQGGSVPKEESGSYTEESELNGTSDCYSPYIAPLETEEHLVFAENDSFAFAETNTVYEIFSSNGENDENEDSMYWLADSDTIQVKNIGDEYAVLKLIGNETKITADLPMSASAEITVNEENGDKALFEVKENESITITFTTLDENKNFVDTTVRGIAVNETVTATETDGGIAVAGLSDVSVTLETEDGTDEDKIVNNSGETVEIAVDEIGVEVEIICNHFDEDHNGQCDNCEEDITANCECPCHSDNWFIQFLAELLYSITEFLGVEKYHYCDCGMSHWE